MATQQPPPHFTVEEYHRLIQANVLTEDDPVELLEGQIVLYDRNAPVEEGSLCCCVHQLLRLMPENWVVRSRCGLALSTSHLEPDLVIARGPERLYARRYAGAGDAVLVVEVSDSSLDRDQLHKTRIYARDRIPVYWVVNLVDRRVEVYTNPNGPGENPRYHTLNVYPEGADVPVVLDGVSVGTIPVNDLLP